MKREKSIERVPGNFRLDRFIRDRVNVIPTIEYSEYFRSIVPVTKYRDECQFARHVFSYSSAVHLSSNRLLLNNDYRARKILVRDRIRRFPNFPRLTKVVFFFYLFRQ